MTDELKKVKCPNCEGRGIVTVTFEDESLNDAIFRDEFKCDDCKGTGRILAIEKLIDSKLKEGK